MPNTGRPSRDCHLCRKRRVKCDLKRPGCQRCVKYGVECPGYREQHELVFRNANPATLKRRKEKAAAKQSVQQRDAIIASSNRGSGSSSGSSSSHRRLGPDTPAPPCRLGLAASGTTAAASSPTSKAIISSGRLVSLPRPLAEHWTNHSVPMLLNVYSTLDFLHNVYRLSFHNGPLIWAAHLFSRTYVTNLRHPGFVYNDSVGETRRELGTYLGKTLSAVNAALQKPEGAFRDDVLATIWVLTNYELLIGSLGGVQPLSPWHVHIQGIYSILKTRGCQTLNTLQGRIAFWPCYNMVQIRALINNSECPPESIEWLAAIRDGPYEWEEFPLVVSFFVTTCTRVQATVVDIFDRVDFAAAEKQFEWLVEQLSEAESKVNQHMARAAAVDAKPADVYMRNLHYTAVIKGHGHISLLCNFLAHRAGSRISLGRLRGQRAQALQAVQAAARSILDSLPESLYYSAVADRGDEAGPRVLFDALKMIWPLTCVLLNPTTSAENKAEAEAALKFIGRQFGVRQALRTYQTPAPLPAEAQVPLDL
ncbi:uncharacterized protein UV8b_02383 [Ustilaginoidea virens]|uniref:Zn(2)-C6 fungal-type domain-containing protein n=1 Tax=Ustilaginoidea virens TaxID=1159556 RepID=A0A8E5MG30_USTVR|nr:uncharacterized protein UV8b_02383 [Ustilaginoidea virens]QUC18142.1 hypothetical protein UV8b_02383 [Ustilaginoidea virens]